MLYDNIKCSKKEVLILKIDNKITKFESFVIFFLMGIIPFIVMGVNYDMPEMLLNGGSYEMFDYFNYVKVMLIKGVALLIVLEFLASIVTNSSFMKYKRDKINLKDLDKKYICCALVVISAIIAFLFSDYKDIAMFGAFERFESIWVQFSYVIIFLYSLKIFKKVGAFSVVTYATLLSTFIVGGIGTLQFLNIDVFNSAIMKALTYKNFNITINMPGSFTTMYNTNTSGLYALFMMFLLAVIFVLAKNIYIKCISVVDFILVAITFLNSYSEASYIAFIVSIGIIIILYLCLMFKQGKLKNFGITLFVSCAVVLGLGVLTFTNQTALNLIDRFIGPEATFTDWSADGNDFYFYNKDDDYIKVELLENSYNVYEDESLILTEDYDTNIGELENLSTEDFNDLQIGIVESDVDGQNYIDFNNYFYIRYLESPAIVSINNLSEAQHYASFGFKAHPNLFTNRGYIWSYSIPMIFEHPFGIGSDVFFRMFPTDNFVGEIFANQPNVVVDKPHNLYLNMAINNGVIYLVAFIGLVILCLKDKIKLLFSDNNVNVVAIMLYLAGCFAFLINVLATDSLVVITMLFWVYLAFSDEFFIRNNDETDEKLGPENKK